MGRPKAKVTVIIMIANMWHDGVKHFHRAKIEMNKEDAERYIKEDQEAGRPERIVIV